LENSQGVIRTRKISLVYYNDVCDLNDAGFDGLDLVAHAGREDNHCGMGCTSNINFGLPGPDSFDNNYLKASGIKSMDHVRRCPRYTTQCPPASHAADEYTWVTSKITHSYAITEYRTTCIRTAGVDSHDSDLCL
jgi:hypothetical protein